MCIICERLFTALLAIKLVSSLTRFTMHIKSTHWLCIMYIIKAYQVSVFQADQPEEKKHSELHIIYHHTANQCFYTENIKTLGGLQVSNCLPKQTSLHTTQCPHHNHFNATVSEYETPMFKKTVISTLSSTKPFNKLVQDSQTPQSPSCFSLMASWNTCKHLCNYTQQRIWPQQTWAENCGGGGYAPFERDGPPSKIMLSGPRPTSVPSGILINPAVWPQKTLAKKNLCPLFRGGGTGSPSNTVALGRGLPPYQVESWSMQPFGRNGYGPKIGGLCPFGGGELCPHLTQCGQGRGLPACQVSSWPSNRLATIHRHRQDRQWSDSIGRTILQMVTNGCPINHM